MDIRHFRYFLAVARQGNFTRAAEQLGIAPPTLTRQIQDMENELGTRLFVRQTREVSLTEAGAALLIEAEATVRQFEYAQRNAQRAGRGDIGHIELGYVASAVYSGLLQKQVQAFSRECPDVSLNVRESPMATLPAMVLEGRFDIGYVRSPLTLPEGLEAIRLDAEGFVLALSSESWLCRLPEISPEHLKGRGSSCRSRSAAPCKSRPRAGLRRSSGRNRAGWWPCWRWCRWGRAWRWCRSRWSGMSGCRVLFTGRSKGVRRVRGYRWSIGGSRNQRRWCDTSSG